ncbi:isoprenylcysteine carboxylmethyltransferase family protein [Defluviimonas aestuarii]|uniref:methyltransferase family protein n=1 Tax=Albidovulum aestuarii TaxID=1130726 RepID=UPI00249AA657|nr:isoprenylcysteine carboxylmethyltransferase family protein [Defluviimonas aestuarii]MDI3336246.1 isoprenylcysteine carboxylmethyltransferase family protein [Defluviimonas aestuarii]
MAKDVDFPPVWLAGFAAIGGLFGRAFPVHLDFNDVVGSILIIVGLILMVVAALQMMAARTTVIPRRNPDAMVTGGVFRLSRNPIYLADVILLTGLYVAWDALIALPMIAVFIYVIQSRFILDEEARLSELFGEEFDAYRAKTRRWL